MHSVVHRRSLRSACRPVQACLHHVNEQPELRDTVVVLHSFRFIKGSTLGQRCACDNSEQFLHRCLTRFASVFLFILFFIIYYVLIYFIVPPGGFSPVGKLGSLAPSKTSCDRVALSNLELLPPHVL